MDLINIDPWECVLKGDGLISYGWIRLTWTHARLVHALKGGGLGCDNSDDLGQGIGYRAMPCTSTVQALAKNHMAL